MRQKSEAKFRTGFLKLNGKNLVAPIDFCEEVGDTNCIGIWMTNIPELTSESRFKRNPYVWAACARFVLAKENFKKTFSPSSDKNTFLICVFDDQNIDNSLEYFEFKVVQNNPSQKTKAHNAWAILESNKTMDIDEN